MTLVKIDLGDVAGGHHPDDYVTIRAEAFREAAGGGITSTAEVKIPLVDGVGQAEVEPGPVVVSFRCRAVADTREKRGVVPASGTVGIEKVLENAFEYLPPVVNDALETIKDAVAAEVDAIKWDRGHVPLDATSISDLDVGSWNVSNDTRAEIVGTPGLRLGNLSIGSIGTSRTATFISQGTASEKPGMWVQAERLGAWSGWQQVLPAVVPPSDLWYRGYVDASHVTLNDLANGVWGVSGRDHAVRLGLPADFGSLQLMQIGSSRSAFFIGQETGMWIATSQGQDWGVWKRPGAALNELNGVGAGLKTVPVAVSTGAGGAGELSGRYRVLTQVTAPVPRFRVHFSTAHPMWEGDRGPSTLGAVYIGHRSGDAGITNQLTLKTGNSTVAAAGEWVTRWITHDLSRETLIDFQVTATNAYNLIAPAWKQDGASWVQQTTVPLWVWLEAETYAETPTVALVGDSTGAGSGSHMPVWDSALHIHARREGFIPVLYASSGDLLEGNTDPEDRNYKRWAGFGPYDSVIIQAGSNDLHNGTTLSVMQENYLAVTEAVAQLSPVVIGATVKPRYPAHPEYDSTRIAYNNWLKTQPGTTRDVLDFSHAVAPGGAIDPADNADGAHLTSSGHQKMATAFDGVTVARAPLASKAAMDAADEALGQRIDNQVQQAKTYTDSAVKDAKWPRGQFNPTMLPSMDDAPEGVITVATSQNSTDWGLPEGRLGFVVTHTAKDFKVQHFYGLVSPNLGEYTRRLTNQGWSPWFRTDNQLELAKDYTDSAVLDAKWKIGGLATSALSSIDEAPEGIVSVEIGSRSVAWGLPGGRLGFVVTTTSKDFRVQVFYAIASTGLLEFTRNLTNQGWSEWVRTDNQLELAKQYVDERTPSKTAYMPLSRPWGDGAGHTRSHANFHARAPLNLQVETTGGIRIGFGNVEYITETIYTAPAVIDRVFVGQGKRGPDGELTGEFVSDPIPLLTEPITLPSDGSSVYTPWGAEGLKLGRDTIVSYGYTSDGTSAYLYTHGTGWYTTSRLDAGLPTPSGHTDSGGTPSRNLPFVVGAEIKTSAPRVLVIGDSHMVGLSSGSPVVGSPASIGAGAGYVPRIHAIGGTRYTSWAERTMIWDEIGMSGADKVLLALGSNDLFGGSGATVADTQEGFLAVVGKIREKVGDVPIHVMEVFPRNKEAGDTTKTAKMVEFNQWLYTLPAGVQSVIPVGNIVDPDTGLVDTRWISNDDVHLSLAGNARLAQNINIV